MSKIEKALRKAIEQNDLVREPEQAMPDAGPESRPSLPQISSGTSGSSIAQMAQPAPISLAERSMLKVIAPELSQTPAVKAFRELRTKIGQRVAADAVIMVTGVSEGGGSSFVASNLATAIAFESARTALLVDCNLRDPALYRLLGDTSRLGLTDYLESDQTEIADIIHPTGIERLRVVPAGRKPDARTEYFTMERMRRLFDALAARYPDRQIILDAPPINISADAQILATFCDHILVVVPYGRVTDARLQSALRSIDPGKLLGVVLNDEPTAPPIGRRFDGKSVLSALRGVVSKIRSTSTGPTQK